MAVGKAEIGAAWSKRSNEGRDYVGLSSTTIRGHRSEIWTKVLGLVVIILLLLLVRAFWVGDIAWKYVGDNLFAPAFSKSSSTRSS